MCLCDGKKIDEKYKQGVLDVLGIKVIKDNNISLTTNKKRLDMKSPIQYRIQ